LRLKTIKIQKIIEVYMGFTKLDENIAMSSIMSEDDSVFKIWILILALTKQDGIAPISITVLSKLTGKAMPEIERCVNILCSPDPNSRTMDNEGRRIKMVNGGIFVINYEKYREYSYSNTPGAIAKRDYRNRIKSDNVRQCPTKDGQSASASCISELNTNSIIYSQDFLTFWKFYPKKVGKGDAWKAWIKLKPPIEQLGKTLTWQKRSPDWLRENGKYIPNPATYLNRRSWEDEPMNGGKKMLDDPNSVPFPHY
jgi:hypothetical protein